MTNLFLSQGLTKITACNSKNRKEKPLWNSLTSIRVLKTELSVDKFRKAVLSLQQSGFSISEISRFLGVGDNTIRRRLKSK